MSSETSGKMSAAGLKIALRKSMLKTLRGIPEAELESQYNAQAVFRQLQQQPFYREAKTIACYLSMAKGELRTTSIVNELLDQGKNLFIPYLPPPVSTETHSPTAPLAATHDRGGMEMLRLYSKEDLHHSPLDKWGIIDPGEHRKDAGGTERRESVMDPDAPGLDLILLPGVAFDEQCNRLGRGKAYYDRFLAAYCGKKASPLLVALALTPQILAEVIAGLDVPPHKAATQALTLLGPRTSLRSAFQQSPSGTRVAECIAWVFVEPGQSLGGYLMESGWDRSADVIA